MRSSVSRWSRYGRPPSTPPEENASSASPSSSSSSSSGDTRLTRAAPAASAPVRSRIALARVQSRRRSADLSSSSCVWSSLVLGRRPRLCRANEGWAALRTLTYRRRRVMPRCVTRSESVPVTPSVFVKRASTEFRTHARRASTEKSQGRGPGARASGARSFRACSSPGTRCSACPPSARYWSLISRVKCLTNASMSASSERPAAPSRLTCTRTSAPNSGNWYSSTEI